MKIALILVLAAILWNIGSNAVRLRKGLRRLNERQRLSEEVDSIMAEVGKKRARLKELSAEFQKRSAARPAFKLSWQPVDDRLIEMKDCLMAFNFQAALAAVCAAVAEAERLVQDPIQQ